MLYARCGLCKKCDSVKTTEGIAWGVQQKDRASPDRFISREGRGFLLYEGFIFIFMEQRAKAGFTDLI